jgi:hypothetical protein
MTISRRNLLAGLGGVTLALPFLDVFTGRGRRAHAAPLQSSFAVFFRQANGCASAQNTSEIGAEPERFWPRNVGALTAANVEGRALAELAPFLDRTLVVGNVNMEFFDYGDGHARGVLQALTGRGPVVDNQGGDSEAGGESLDHRIGRQLNQGGADSLFMHAGDPGGWLSGACMSYRGAGQRRAAHRNPFNAYQQVVGGLTGASGEELARLAQRNQSVNDLVRDQIETLRRRSELSAADRQRLSLHFDSIRELEVAMSCHLETQREAELEASTAWEQITDGDFVLATARLHMDVAAIAVTCGQNRSVAIQIGNGNDGTTRYRDPDTGQRMENYHFISHRRTSHGTDGSVIGGSDLMHHKIDRQFAQTFRYLLERLDGYAMPEGGTLLDHGVAVWFNDLSNGPEHGALDVPWILAGGAGGFFKRGQYVRAGGGGTNHVKLLNSIGAAVGVTSADGEPLDDFGDPSLPRGQMTELHA